MSQQISVSVKSRTSNGQTHYEGTATIAGLKPSKLSKSDGNTQFTTAGSVRSAAQRLGDRLGLTVSFEEKAQVKQAAKKSVRTKAKATKPTPPSTGTCPLSGN
jgi:hypothetical protein